MVTKSEDVAKAAGVSRATVSQILNGRGQRFSEATRERVRRAAADLGYKPSVAGRALATGSSDIVVALLPSTTMSENLQDVLEQATDELAQHGLTLVLRLTAGSAAPLARMVATLRPRVALALVPFTKDERLVLEQHGVVPVDPSEAETGFDRLIGRTQAEHLIGKGYRRLAYVHIDDHRIEHWAPPREAGVREVCAEHGLAAPMMLRPRMVPDEVLDAVDTLRTGTAVACYNDHIAISLLHAAAARGRAVPEDIALIGMDATPLSAMTHPGLTTISIDVEAAGKRAVATLLADLGLPGPSVLETPMAPQVVERGTT